MAQEARKRALKKKNLANWELGGFDPINLCNSVSVEVVQCGGDFG